MRRRFVARNDDESLYGAGRVNRRERLRTVSPERGLPGTVRRRLLKKTHKHTHLLENVRFSRLTLIGYRADCA